MENLPFNSVLFIRCGVTRLIISTHSIIYCHSSVSSIGYMCLFFFFLLSSHTESQTCDPHCRWNREVVGMNEG